MTVSEGKPEADEADCLARIQPLSRVAFFAVPMVSEDKKNNALPPLAKAISTQMLE